VGSRWKADIIDDLAFRPGVPAQSARSLQSTAHLVDCLPWTDADPAREFVIIQRAAGAP